MGQYDTTSSTQTSEAVREIDLMDLFAILWEGRWIILGFNLIAAVIGFVVIQAMPSVYRVEAVLAGPSSYLLQALQPSVLHKPALSAKSTDDAYGGDYQVAPIEPKTVYVAALAEINSLSLKRQYWESEGSTLAGGEFGGGDEGGEFRAFARSLQLTRPQSIPDVGTLAQLDYLTEYPDVGVELLNRYLVFAERSIMNRQISQLQSGLQSSLERLEGDYVSLVEQEKLKLEDQLVRLQEAQQVATALGIIDLPYDKIENVWISLLDDRDYLLGTAVLDEEIGAIRGREEKPLEAFVPHLRQMGQWRDQIKRDLQRLQAVERAVGAFSVVTPPEPSLSPVKPNKPLLLVAVVFGTFILSAFIVLFRHGWRSYKARTA